MSEKKTFAEELKKALEKERKAQAKKDLKDGGGKEWDTNKKEPKK